MGQNRRADRDRSDGRAMYFETVDWATSNPSINTLCAGPNVYGEIACRFAYR